MSIINISDLNLRMKDVSLLDSFSLSLSQGQRIGITGPSGCGKSTLIKSVINNKFPNSSAYKAFTKEENHRYFYIPQSNGLLPWFSLKANLQIFSNDPTLFLDVVNKFKLMDILDNFPHQLSGGEYQRAILAAAILNQTEVFLADEPLTELDINNKWTLLSYWSKNIKETGSTLLLVSHDIETLIYMCDSIIVLSDKPSVVLNELNISQEHPRLFGFLNSASFHESKQQLLDAIQD